MNPRLKSGPRSPGNRGTQTLQRPGLTNYLAAAHNRTQRGRKKPCAKQTQLRARRRASAPGIKSRALLATKAHELSARRSGRGKRAANEITFQSRLSRPRAPLTNRRKAAEISKTRRRGNRERANFRRNAAAARGFVRARWNQFCGKSRARPRGPNGCRGESAPREPSAS